MYFICKMLYVEDGKNKIYVGYFNKTLTNMYVCIYVWMDIRIYSLLMDVSFLFANIKRFAFYERVDLEKSFSFYFAVSRNNSRILAFKGNRN